MARSIVVTIATPPIQRITQTMYKILAMSKSYIKKSGSYEITFANYFERKLRGEK
jgi:hypothetical protein